MDLSLTAIQQLSPDEASLKAARGLVVPAKWPTLGMTDAAIWGECQGSGAKPYQVQVDKTGPAFKCSCPSRKFPCKHGLALLLLANQNSNQFIAQDTPGWVNDWLDGRQQKAEKSAEKKAEKAVQAAAPDPAAQAKREQQRLARMGDGLAELQTWMSDQVRQGLGRLPQQLGDFDRLSQRMVDNQLPGVAARIQRWSQLLRKTNWASALLGEFGLLQLQIDGFSRREHLEPAVRDDLLAALGITQDKDDLQANRPAVEDTWTVLGLAYREEQRLWIRRVWLLGQQSGRLALILDFAHGNRHFEQAFIPGQSLNAQLVFYPGNSQRALLKASPHQIELPPPQFPSLDNALQQMAETLALNPWAAEMPFALKAGRLVQVQGDWFVADELGRTLSLAIAADQAWSLLAETGGQPVAWFGEWDHSALQPLSVWAPQLCWQVES